MTTEHKDILGQTLREGSYVAISHHNQLQICLVTKLSSKMMRAKPLKDYYRGDGHLKYPNQSVLLSGPDALAYILKNAAGS